MFNQMLTPVSSHLMRRLAAAVALSAALTACSTLPRNPVPIADMNRATIPGMPGVRNWGDEPSREFQRDLVRSVREEQAARAPGEQSPAEMAALVLSGGGSNGAFGAGYLVGWSETGTRPTFKLVTGISTGALIAPFAFLGSDYDRQLEAMYTQLRSKDIYRIRSPFTVLKRDSLAVTDPLKSLIEVALDETFLEAIATEHRRGRRLYVGTTNLDAQRLVVWNMGAIAASNHPGAADLFREVLLASASIPVAFPPVYIEVEVDGLPYDEMHVDGGVIAAFFLWGATVDLSDAIEAFDGKQRRQTAMYIIRNSQIDPEPQEVPRELTEIASRSMVTLLKAVAIGDLIRLWALAERDGVDFNYIGIPANHPEADASSFDPTEMRRLFSLGHDIATGDRPWRKEPPAFLEWTEAHVGGTP
jgi:predicted acylesterase/phospholipase RssA